MVLPLIFSALGGALGGAGALGGIGALGGAALGSGLGTFAETGDLEKGILSGLGAFAGGTALGALTGGAAGGAAGNAAANTPAVGAGLAKAGMPGASGVAALPMKAPLTTIGSAAAPMNAIPKPGISGIGRNAMNFAQSPMGMATGIGGMVGSSFGGGGRSGGEMEQKNDNATEMKPIPNAPLTPPAGYKPGYDPEFNYGVGTPPTAAQVLDYRDRGIMPRRMAEGGIAELANAGQEAAPAANDKDVVANAISAIKGQSSSPEIALGAFLAKYGEEALRELVDKVQSGEMDDTVQRSEGKLSGAGDGMDDMIPASIAGKEDVLLSDGEFVVPADVVSGLGNGSSDAGARELERMMERIRQARHGSTDQPPKIDKKTVIPA